VESDVFTPYSFGVDSDLLQCKFLLAMLIQIQKNYTDAEITYKIMEAMVSIQIKHSETNIDSALLKQTVFFSHPDFFLVIVNIIKKFFSTRITVTRLNLYRMNYVCVTNDSFNYELLAKRCFCALQIIYETTSKIIVYSATAYEDSNYICFTAEYLANLLSLTQSYPVSFLSADSLTAVKIGNIYSDIAEAQSNVRYIYIQFFML
jgi:hypothetical protein